MWSICCIFCHSNKVIERSHFTVCSFSEPKFVKFFLCNPRQSSTSLTILVSIWFSIISLVFSVLVQARIQDFERGVNFLHLNQRNQILFQYLRDKEKKKKEGGSEKGG